MSPRPLLLTLMMTSAAMAQAPAQPAAPPAGPPALAQPARPAPPAGMPTIEQLRQQLDAGQHQEVLRTVAKLMSLKGPAAQAYDRYELLMLRGEAALRNKALPMSAEAFKAAQQETDDPDKQAVARANELLVRKSRQDGYVARTPLPAQPSASGETGAAPPGARPAAAGDRTILPIIDDAERKQAFAALFADELAVAQPKLKPAAKAKNLNPIIDAARTLGDLRALEIAAHGEAPRTKEIGATLGERAHQMIMHAMDGMDKQVEEIWSDASRSRISTNYRTGYQQRQYGLHGLDSTQARALKEIAGTTEKLIPVSRDLAAVTDAADLKSDAQAAQRLHDRARQVLTFDYANEGRDTSRSQPQDLPRIPTSPTGGSDVIRP